MISSGNLESRPGSVPVTKKSRHDEPATSKMVLAGALIPEPQARTDRGKLPRRSSGYDAKSLASTTR